MSTLESSLPRTSRTTLCHHMIHSSPIKDTGHMFLFSLLGPAEKKITSCFRKFPPPQNTPKCKTPRSHGHTFSRKRASDRWRTGSGCSQPLSERVQRCSKPNMWWQQPGTHGFYHAFLFTSTINIINHQSTISSLSLTVAKTHPQELQQMRLHGELATAIRIHVVRLCVAFGVSPLEDLLKFGWGHDA